MLPDFVLNSGELGPPFANVLLVTIALRYSPGTNSPGSLPVACPGRASNILVNDCSLGRDVRVKARNGYNFSSTQGLQTQ